MGNLRNRQRSALLLTLTLSRRRRRRVIRGCAGGLESSSCADGRTDQTHCRIDGLAAL